MIIFQITRLPVKDLVQDLNLGLIPISKWVVYQINDVPGLIFVKNPFTTLGQRYWITKCLSKYTRKPSKLNLDSLNCLDSNEDWWSYCCNSKDTSKNSLLHKLRWATLGYHHNWDTKVS